MTAVRIAHADPWPERQPVGLVVLADTVPADNGGHRVLPVRLPARAVWRLLARPDDRDQEHPEDDAGQMTGQLLHAAGITVTAVTVTDLGPAVTATRIDIAVPGGTRQVTTRLADGLALAVITGAPLAVDDPVMDRLAEPVTGPDPLGPFRSRQQPPPGPAEHTRFEPRNLAFTDGLHRWQLDGTFLRQAGFHDQDYSCTTEDGRAILTAAVPGPAGFAVLGQEIEPDDYRGRAVTFRGDLRATDVADRAGLVLRIPRQGRRPAPADPWHDPENRFALVSGTRDWTRHEVTVPGPGRCHQHHLRRLPERPRPDRTPQPATRPPPPGDRRRKMHVARSRNSARAGRHQPGQDLARGLLLAGSPLRVRTQSPESSDADSPRRTPAWLHIGKPTLEEARCENSNSTSTDASVRTQ